MNDSFEKLQFFLACIRDSENPSERLLYLKSLKELLQFGEKLNKMKPSEELKGSLSLLEQKIKEYQLYPKVNDFH